VAWILYSLSKHPAVSLVRLAVGGSDPAGCSVRLPGPEKTSFCFGVDDFQTLKLLFPAEWQPSTEYDHSKYKGAHIK